MSNRQQFPFDVGQMGQVWVASIALLGISAIGDSRNLAIQGVLEAFATHSASNDGPPLETCEACT